MKNKLLSVCKNNLTLIIVVAALLIFDIILGFIDGWKLKEYVSGILTEIIGIIITVIFVDVMFNKSQENTQRESEKKKILCLCRLIELYLPRYIIYFNQLTNHPCNIFDCEIAALGNSQGSVCHIGGKCEIIMNQDQEMFYKTDMLINYIHFSCMYEDSRLFISGGFRSNIDCFYYIEKKIQNAFMRLLTEIDFIYYKEIEKIAIDFLNISISNDISDFIKHNKRIVCESNENKKLKIEIDTKVLASKSFNDVQDFKNSHNNLVPYQLLKDALNNERRILHEYLAAIEKIRGKK